MFFEMVYDKSLAQASYIIGCQASGIAAVVDAKRDVDTYLEIAAANNLKITQIFETHIHADFLSGSRELAELTGATLYLSDEGRPDWQYNFTHHGLHHGDVVDLGRIKIEVKHTPGHTPEHICFLITDTPASPEPVLYLTGDFVFVGDVGRPDLLETAAGIKGSKEEGAEKMYNSLLEFMKLPDHVQVWPGHGAGSACGKALGAVASTTVGYEKIRNWALQLLDDKEAFIAELLSGQPETPKYFAEMKKRNKEERNLITQISEPKNLNSEEWAEAKEQNWQIIDTRHPNDFAKEFLPGSINILNNNAFANWSGSLLNYDEPLVLITEKETAAEAQRKLLRIGLDELKGFITPQQLHEYEEGKLEPVKRLDKNEVKSKLNDLQVQIVDVRNEKEVADGKIGNSDHVFLGTLPNNVDKIKRDKEVIVHCQSGVRASTAYSILKAKGFNNVSVYPGGMNEWSASIT